MNESVFIIFLDDLKESTKLDGFFHGCKQVHIKSIVKHVIFKYKLALSKDAVMCMVN